MVPNGAVSFYDYSGSKRDMIPQYRFFPDEDIMTGWEIGSDPDISIQNGAGSNDGIISDYNTRMILLSNIIPGRKTERNRIKDLYIFSNLIIAIFEHDIHIIIQLETE